VAAGGTERAALGLLDEQAVDGDVGNLGHADDGIEAGGDLGVLVAGDRGGLGVERCGELTSRQEGLLDRCCGSALVLATAQFLAPDCTSRSTTPAR